MTFFSYAISEPEPGLARYTWTSGLPDFHVVRVGDYVNLTCPGFSALNRGSFVIVAVSSIHNGSTGWVNYFEVENADVVAEGPIDLTGATEVQFYRQSRARLHNIAGREVVLAQGPNGSLDVVLPATTQVVGRDELSAAYLPARSTISVTSVQVIGSGEATATTDGVHGLAVDDHVILDGLWTTTAVPATVAGVPSTVGLTGSADAAQLDLWSEVRSDIAARADHAACLLSTGDVLVAGGWDLAATFLSTCSRFTLVDDTVLNSGNAVGRRQYEYNWTATAALPATSADLRLIALQGAGAGQALRTGGRNGGGAQATAQVYDATANAWTTVPVGTLTARYNHEMVRVVNALEEEVVYIVGGQLTATTATGNVEKFTLAAGGTLAATALSEATARYGHKVVAINDNAFVVVGGASFSAGNPIVRHDCWGYDEVAAAGIVMGNLAIARMEHAAVKLTGETVMVIGGLGRNLTNETTNRVLHECEIWDNASKVWRPAPRLRVARKKPNAIVLDGRVYVFGGKDGAGALVSTTEVFDIASGRWLGAAASGDLAVCYGAAVSEWDGIVFVQGGERAAAAVDDAFLFMPGLRLGLDVNGTVKVVTVPTSTTFTFTVATGNYSFLEDGAALIVGAAATDYAGPYIWNEDGDAAITGTNAVLQEDLAAGQQYRTLTVDDATGFPDEPGWLALAYGSEDAVYPVPYLGKISGTVLTLDFSFRFPRAVPTGSVVTLLAQKGPYVPETPEEDGSAYITGSSAGRVAAQAALEESTSAGRALNITVAYPGDKGLGAAGYGVTGQKLSDKVAVWGGDDLDAELAAAREEE